MNPSLVVLFAGVGGQGVLSAARFLGNAAHRLGMPVTVSQLHGMSQRGGAVQATVAFGSDEILALGEQPVDALVGLDLLETLRVVGRAAAAGIVLCNRRLLPPPGLPAGMEQEAATEIQRLVPRAVFLDATGLAEQAGDRRALNVVLLGAFASLPVCPIPLEEVMAAIRTGTAEAAWATNDRAFALGREAVS